MKNTNKITQIIGKMQKNATEHVDFMKIFSIKDLKAGSFGALFLANSVDESIRACKIRLIYERDSILQQFPNDFMLYHVGYFNTNTGLIETTGVSVPIKSIFDIVQELDTERINKPVELPEFLQKKGVNENVDSNQKSSTD